MILIASKLLRKNVNAMAIYPFVLLKDKRLKDDSILLQHERIHIRQQLELLIIPFYIWYLVEYTINLIKYKNGYAAYRNISFEKEAYAMEATPNYFTKRKLWAFWKFL